MDFIERSIVCVHCELYAGIASALETLCNCGLGIVFSAYSVGGRRKGGEGREGTGVEINAGITCWAHAVCSVMWSSLTV